MIVNCFVGGVWNEPFESDFEGKTIVHMADIPPEDERERDGYTVLGIEEAHPHLRAGTQSIFVDGVLSYSDGFGERYSTRFRYASTEGEYDNSKFSVTPEGNVAT
jgi:hypothetical protein